MAEETVVEEPKKKPGLLKWIILVVLLLLLGGGGFFAYQFFLAKKSMPEQAATGEKAPEKAAEAPAEGKSEAKPAEGGHGGEAKKGKDGKPDNLVTIPSFVVNLADPQARRYLKLNIDVEVTGSPELIERNMPKIRDGILLLLSSKTSQDLSSMEGKITLRKEIADRINQAIGQSKVARVYFTELVIQ